MTAPTETPYLRAAFLAGPLAAGAAMLLSGIVVLFARGLDDFSVTSVARTSAQVWLTSIGSGITAGGVTITVVPIGALLVTVLVVAAVVRWVLPDPVDDLPAFVISTAGSHGLVGAVISAVAGTGGVDISPIRAVAAACVVGGVGAGLGAVGRHGGSDALWFTVSDHLRRALRAGLSGVLAMLTAATSLVVLLLLIHLDRAGDLWALLDTGVGGGIALAAGSLLAVPNLVLWTAATLIGPGFALGSDTSVDLTGAQLGAVPGFPVLAALPSPGEFPGWVFLLGLVPLAAGAVAGWRACTDPSEELRSQIVAGVAAGAAAGFMLGVLIGASGGAIGPGRMEQAGPAALTPLLVAVPVMAVGGGIGAVLAHYRGERALHSSPEPGADAGPPGRSRLWRRHQSPSADRRHEQS
ncbi:MAG: DUF6350 family protein [Aeromicrobium sp.]